MKTICGLILLLTLSIQKSGANDCQKLPPGLDRLIRGIDITKLDLIPTGIAQSNGFNHPIIEFTCDTVRKWSNPDDPSISYDIPDQVDTINSLPGGSTKYKSHLFKSSEDVKKSMSVNVGLGDTTGSFSLSGSYQDSQQSFLDNVNTIAEQSAYESAYEVVLKPNFKLQIGASVRQFMDNFLPATYQQNPDKYQEFLSIFGSHYFSSGFYGGFLSTKIEITDSLSKRMNDNQLKVEATATFENGLKLHGGFAGSTAQVSEDFKKNSHTREAYYGGNANLMSGGADAYSKWWNTVARNPWLFGGKLLPITNLLPASSKRDAISQAIVVRQDKAYIDELINSIDFVSKRRLANKLSITANNYRNQLNALKVQVIPNHSEVISLGNVINPFLNVVFQDKAYIDELISYVDNASKKYMQLKQSYKRLLLSTTENFHRQLNDLKAQAIPDHSQVISLGDKIHSDIQDLLKHHITWSAGYSSHNF